jgi:hypothetical protein
MLPNLLIIGAEKSATTTLCNHLNKHPDICFSSTKEVHFFNDLKSNGSYNSTYGDKGVQWYESFFSECCKASIIGEATPMYLCDKEAPKRISKILPKVRLLVILRNPIDRAYSHYWMAKGKGEEEEDFARLYKVKGCAIFERGLYSVQIQNYLEYFSLDRMHLILYEDYISAPNETLSEVFNFLDVDDSFSSEKLDRLNVSSQVRFVVLYKIIRFLIRFFRHSSNLSFVINFLKKIKIVNAIIRLNTKKRPYPELDKNTRRELEKYYIKDILLLTKLTGINFYKKWIKNQ